jgi:7-cyano-7-deazaguanine synthase in queuosine biosynthesis
MVAESMAPDWRAISLPARNTIMVGIARILKRPAGAGSSCVFNLANRSLGSN